MIQGLSSNPEVSPHQQTAVNPPPPDNTLMMWTGTLSTVVHISRARLEFARRGLDALCQFDDSNGWFAPVLWRQGEGKRINQSSSVEEHARTMNSGGPRVISSNDTVTAPASMAHPCVSVSSCAEHLYHIQLSISDIRPSGRSKPFGPFHATGASRKPIQTSRIPQTPA